MKVYDWHIAPNPRRLHIYLAEKGIKVDLEEVSGEGFRLLPSYIAKYPHAMVPMLELDDGTLIGEVMAIARYFEELHPDPPLMGTHAKDKAIVEMWERRANEEGMLAASELFRNTHDAFAERGLPGSALPVPRIPALVDRANARLARFFSKLDKQLADNEFVAGSRYTIADVTTLCGIDFAKWTAVEIPPDYKNLRRWYDAVSARPSAKA